MPRKVALGAARRTAASRVRARAMVTSTAVMEPSAPRAFAPRAASPNRRRTIAPVGLHGMAWRASAHLGRRS